MSEYESLKPPKNELEVQVRRRLLLKPSARFHSDDPFPLLQRLLREDASNPFILLPAWFQKLAAIFCKQLYARKVVIYRAIP